MAMHSLRGVAMKSLLIFVLGVAACSTPAPKVESPAPGPPKAMFPPQEAMQSGNYRLFLEENQKKLLECSEEPHCAVALFNLGFIYAYPRSPYHNLSKGLFFFEALIRNYPEDPWSFQAKAWTEFMKRCIASETSKRQMKGALKSKETALKELQKQVEQTKQTDVEIDRIEKDLQSKETTIKELKKQVEQSKQTDLEMDRIEKDLQKPIERSQEVDVKIERKERRPLK